MRKIFIVLIAFLVFGCKTEQKPKNSFVIQGKITNAGSKFLVFIHQSLADTKMDTVSIDETGNFRIQQDLQKPDYFSLAYDSQKAVLFLIPGDSLYVTFPGDNFVDSLKFSGEGALVNNYIAKKSMIKRNLPDRESLFSLQETAFVSKLDSVKNLLLQSIGSFTNENPSANEKFLRLEKAAALYSWAKDRLLYENNHRYYAKDDSFKVSDSYNNYMKEINVNDSDLIQLEQYSSFVESYVGQLIDKKYESLSGNEYDNTKYVNTAIQVANETFQNKAIKDYIIFSQLKDQVKYESSEGLETFLNEFYANSANPDFVSKLKEETAKWAHLTKGNIAPTFTFPDITGKSISLTDFKGKYVYIDFWATWCGPCRREIPVLKELEKKYKGKPIVFMSVSVDKDKEAWQKMVKEEQLKGVQLHSENDEGATKKNYLIYGIPRFVLIDKEGKLIDATAKRPSGKIALTIDSLLSIK